MNNSGIQNHQKSFIQVSEESDFPIENLPYGIATQKSNPKQTFVAVAIGEMALNLGYLYEHKFIDLTQFIGSNQNPFYSKSLNEFVQLGKSTWSELRKQITSLLSINSKLPELKEHFSKSVLKQSDLVLHLPFDIGGFTDFYASEIHATNVGRLYRGPDQALMPNWKHLPIAYNGRASTVVESGHKVVRPWGQIKDPAQASPSFEPSRKLDFEVELGFFVGKENNQGNPILLEEASDYIFGVVLLNDWSARDIQAWEYQPLGPFLGKSFATTISPWVVTMEALREAKVPREIPDSPNLLPYLKSKEQFLYNIDIDVELKINKEISHSHKICSTNSRHLNWSFEQMLVHHASNGCKMKVGDLLGTGTVSGPLQSSWGSLLELTFNGKEDLTIGTQSRKFLEDFDEIIMRAKFIKGNVKIGFGECRGQIYPSVELTQVLGGN